MPHPDILVGYETADDAGVYRLDEDRALVQTVDFFTPVVDDPYTFGAVAAANALSDVYAMGGIPLTAMAIACFPEEELGLDVLVRIMTGGVEKLQEAGVALLGGHTVTDAEIKFGYSVTGLVHPGRVMRNSGAKPGDALVLTKPLGIGLITSAIKFRKTSNEAAEQAIRVMTTLNRTASDTMLRHECHAATDITGNGLLGHAFEMAEASRATLRFDAKQIPYLPEALAIAQSGLLPRSIGTTWRMIEPSTRIGERVSESMRSVLLDPQTSGGLLISVAPSDCDPMLRELRSKGVDATRVGEVESGHRYRLIVE